MHDGFLQGAVRKGVWTRTALAAGLLAGTVDIGSAALIYRASPLAIMRAIAGGVLGPAAVGMGWPVALLGLVLQWAMSVLIAAIFVRAAVRVPGLRRRFVLAGCAYGLIVFVVMQFVVVPLSALHRWPHFTWPWFLENLLAMAVFGVLVAWVTRSRLPA